MVRVDRFDGDTVTNVHSTDGEFVGDGLSNPAVVDDSSVGCVKSLQPNGIRFDFGDLAGADPAQAGNRVGAAARLEIVEPGQFPGVGRHDELAAALVGDRVVIAVVVHQPRTLHAQPGLQRAGLVVDAAVNHPGVVAALVPGGGGLPLQHRDGVVGTPGDPLPGHGQADDAGADDDEVMLRFHTQPT